MKSVPALVVLAFALLLAAPATALEQPGGTPIPSDMGCDGGDPTGLAATFACICDSPGVCNIGDACPGDMNPDDCDDGQNGTCETTLWHDWNDNPCVPSNLSGLDPWAEAATTPETFQPTCPLTFTVVTRGTAMFEDVFGWYNVTGEKPGIDDLHVMLDCDDPAGTPAVLDVFGDPDYLGGEVGFFLATPEDHADSGTCADGNCCASLERIAAGDGYIFYSQRAYNPDAAGADSYIHLLIYDSRITEHKFYFAWEDIYGGSNNDFTDIVTSVEGVECSGGGVACDTGLDGACQHGITSCRDGSLQCVQLRQSSEEVCDGVDNNCNGEIDESATCPDGGVCDNGRCLPDCETGSEFQCPTYSICDTSTGLCVDPDCEGVTCDEGQVCVGGDCVTACDGIVCPHGTTCREGECIDPCQHVSCDEGEVCREGICFPGCNECDGVVCGDELACDTATGECLDSSCASGCPDGTFCQDGSCIDSCDGAVCPSGQICVDGQCCHEGECGDDPPAQVDAGTGGGADAPSNSGCGCRTDGSGGAGGALLALLLGLWLSRRRTR